MKKLLMILTIVFFLGAVGSTFISPNLGASGPGTDPKPVKTTGPYEDYGSFGICYNTNSKVCP